MKIRYVGFWDGLETENFFITKSLRKSHQIEIVNDETYDIIVMSMFGNNILQKGVKKNTIKILFNGEHPSYIENFIKVTGVKPDIIIGFVDSIKREYNLLQLYYPLWLLYYENIFDQEYFDKKNNEVMSMTLDKLRNKRFACLINSHDKNYVRTPIYNVVDKYGSIDCPGKLLNNMPNHNVGSTNESKLEFMKKYKYNICGENCYGNKYFTEKLPQCVDAGCIPIYLGDFNDFNKKIFNEDRVIHITQLSELNKITKMMEELSDENKLLEFYRRPVFNQDAYKYINQLNKITDSLINNKVNDIIKNN